MPSGQRIVRLAAEAAQAPTPLEALRTTSELRRELDAFERQQVARALADGTTFAQIARDLGVTRQSAHRRFRALSGVEPLVTAPDARRVIGYAREEASALSADTPRSEHILLGALRAADVPAAAVLRNAGVTLERARTVVEAASPRAPGVPRGRPLGDLRAMLSGAAREARDRGGRRIDVEHLLIGALEDTDGGAAQTLRAVDVQLEAVRAELTLLLESQPA